MGANFMVKTFALTMSALHKWIIHQGGNNPVDIFTDTGTSVHIDSLDCRGKLRDSNCLLEK